MASSVPLQFAETIQTAHLRRDPSREHDINPSTTASRKEPATLEEHPIGYLHDEGIDEGDYEEDIPYSVVRPKRRASHLPPLPDLRFEQSYLHSISRADSWWKIAWITTRDQVGGQTEGYSLSPRLS